MVCSHSTSLVPCRIRRCLPLRAGRFHVGENRNGSSPLASSFAIGCVAALGEEIGWSGFLVPQVAKGFGFTAAAPTRGIVWSIWHYPMIIARIFRNESPIWFNLVCFTVLLTGTSFIYAWLRLKSGNLWTGMFLHASHNAFIQSFFSRITSATAITANFIDEFGAALAILSVVFAFAFWRKRTSLPSEALGRWDAI